MSDAESPNSDVPSVPEDEIPDSDGFEPVDVFPDEEFDLRGGADNCYKCSTCDTNCPVTEVDDDFPGPKFQGPEQWRLKQTDEDYDVDESVMQCSNCMRCDSSCPSGVPLSQMHNAARAQYVDEKMSRFSVKYWRNRVLANYRTFAKLGSAMPRLANTVLNNSLVQAVNERLFGITSERDFPPFARETFRAWWDARGGAATSRGRARAGGAGLATAYSIGVATLIGLGTGWRWGNPAGVPAVALAGLLHVAGLIAWTRPRSGARALSVDVIEAATSVLAVTAPSTFVDGGAVQTALTTLEAISVRAIFSVVGAATADSVF
jgi:heterodisulfide reductase subunit C